MFFTHYALIRRFDLSLYNINLNVLVYTHISTNIYFDTFIFYYIFVDMFR